MSNDLLMKYFETYEVGDKVQASENAYYDNQIKCFRLHLVENISKNKSGTIIDLGCGKGVLLQALLNIEEFKNNTKWLYCGVDNSEHIKIVNDLAFKNNMNRRVELCTLDDFYNKDIEELNLQNPYIFVCRNVLHELSIDESTLLIEYLLHNLGNGTLYLQDLTNFKIGERGNVCWDSDILRDLLINLGFNIIKQDDISHSRSKWFTAIVTLQKSIILKTKEIEEMILKAKVQLYRKKLKDFEKKRDSSIETIDEDVQLASLVNQISKKGVQVNLPKSQNEYLVNTFKAAINSFNKDKIPTSYLEGKKDFRDRAHAQDWLGTILQNTKGRGLLTGGSSIGKSYLLNEVLARRSHGKSTIIIELYKTSNVWSIIEQLLDKLGIKLRTEIVAQFTDISFSSVRNTLKQVFADIGDRIILVIKHLENLLNVDGFFSDVEIRDLIEDITNSNINCVIYSSKCKCKNAFFNNISTHHIGLFPDNIHVCNILDDYIQRNNHEVTRYPDELLDAIGKHPYMTYFAAKIIQKEGIDVLKDIEFIKLLKNRMKNELLIRLIDDNTLPAMKILSQLRIATPIESLRKICSEESLYACISDGIAYELNDYTYNKTIISIAKIDIQDDDEHENDLINEPNNEKVLQDIRDMYMNLYKSNSDPIWLRETFYFCACLNDIDYLDTLGKMYSGEIKAAAYYWYSKKRDYPSALWAFRKVSLLGDNGIDVQLKISSALIRTRIKSNIIKGIEQFENIIKKSSYKSYKTSFIDSLLFIGEFQLALRKLSEYGFKETDGFWIANEYGSAYLGLKEYEKSINAFCIASTQKDDSYTFSNLARAYYCYGEFKNELSTLFRAIKLYRTNKSLQCQYAAALLRTGTHSNALKAGAILNELFSNYERDAKVASLYCKFLCRVGDITPAEEILNSLKLNDKENVHKKMIQLYIGIARKKWDRCIEIVNELDCTESYRTGMIKKIYLYWAKDQNSIAIAQKGLKIPLPKEYKNNIPFRLTHISLAKVANRNDIIINEKKLLKQINKNIDIDSSLTNAENDFGELSQ